MNSPRNGHSKDVHGGALGMGHMTGALAGVIFVRVAVVVIVYQACHMLFIFPFVSQVINDKGNVMLRA